MRAEIIARISSTVIFLSRASLSNKCSSMLVPPDYMNSIPACCYAISMPFVGNDMSTDCDYYITILGLRIDTDGQVDI